jgi:RNA polymerase sigma-70 factor (ECF subfamily)
MIIKEEVPSLEEVLVKYWPQVRYRVKNSIGSLTPDWEDVGSEVILAVIQALKEKKFRGESSLSTFIYAVTTNKIMDFLRRKMKAPPEAPVPTGWDLDPYQHVEKEERVKLLASLLKRLKPRLAQVMYLHYFLEVPRDEIARAYGITPGRVNDLISEGRRTLEKLMNNLHPDDKSRRSL